MRLLVLLQILARVLSDAPRHKGPRRVNQEVLGAVEQLSACRDAIKTARTFLKPYTGVNAFISIGIWHGFAQDQEIWSKLKK